MKKFRPPTSRTLPNVEDTTTAPPKSLSRDIPLSGRIERIALVVIWYRDEPARVGEALLVPSSSGGPWTFGRGAPSPKGSQLTLSRHWMSEPEPSPPIACSRISREQLRLFGGPLGALAVENVGRCPLIHREERVSRVVPAPGDILELENELLFLCVRWTSAPAHAEALLRITTPRPFGEVDAFGMVGEGRAMRDFRRSIAAISHLTTHVLLLGPSGSGKELVAQAIHAEGPRSKKPMVARNAATLPEGLVDAELFGNIRNYPNPGTPERPGIFGQADGTTLFLDEIAELPVSAQAHLLRVLDDGEYQRLGEATSRLIDFRLVGATNRPESYLKHDVLARFEDRVTVPDLNARREDIPLLVIHILRRRAAGDAASLCRFFAGDDPRGAPRISPEAIRALVQHQYTTNVRELERLVVSAALGSPGRYVEIAGELRKAVESAQGARCESPLETFTPEENRRLAIQRKYRFNATDCGRDPEYKGNRQTADLHLRQLAGKALAAARWDVDDAAALLAGAERDLQDKARTRIEKFLANLRRRMERGEGESEEALRRSLADEWRGSFEVVLKVLDALQKGLIRDE